MFIDLRHLATVLFTAQNFDWVVDHASTGTRAQFRSLKGSGNIILIPRWTVTCKRGQLMQGWFS